MRVESLAAVRAAGALGLLTGLPLEPRFPGHGFQLERPEDESPVVPRCSDTSHNYVIIVNLPVAWRDLPKRFAKGDEKGYRNLQMNRKENDRTSHRRPRSSKLPRKSVCDHQMDFS